MTPQIRFLSLFVSDLEDAARRYRAFLGAEPARPGMGAVPPSPHPFAAAGPVIFDLGAARLALYQADGRTTHPGDIAIGLESGEPAAALAARARTQKCQVFHGPELIPGTARNLAALMTPDRHFFEIVGG